MLAHIQFSRWLYIAEPPRCGTSSVRWACHHSQGFTQCGEIHPRRHAFADEAQAKLKTMPFADITTAICTRNPYSRAWSLKKWWWGAHNREPISFEAMINQAQQVDDSWRRLLRPQTAYAKLANGETITTHTLHLETINNDLAKLGRRISIDFAPVPHHNAFLDRHRMPTLTTADLSFIREYYHADFALGGYDDTKPPKFKPTTSPKSANPYSGL